MNYRGWVCLSMALMGGLWKPQDLCGTKKWERVCNAFLFPDSREGGCEEFEKFAAVYVALMHGNKGVHPIFSIPKFNVF